MTQTTPPAMTAPSAVLREVALPDGIDGRLFLTGLPDSETRLADFLTAAQGADVSTVLCLLPTDEVAARAPGYAAAVLSDTSPFDVLRFAIRDFGVPDDAAAFLHSARTVSAALGDGARVVVHCRGGIGRSGMMAQGILVALGMPPALAEAQVAKAGSHCETPEQTAFLARAVAQPQD